VLELNTCKESIIKTSLQQSGSWSPDGKKILYALPQIVNEILTVSIYQIDLAGGENSLELGEDNQGQIDYGLPAWSPDGNWVVVGIRLAGTTESRQLVLTQLDGSKAQQITQTPVYNYAAYQWDPWGTAIIFQRFPQGQSGGEPEVGVWEKANGKITILAQNAAMPAWMP
jgi:Tol biopolymer transport system component